MKNLQRIRKEKGLSQSELSEKALVKVKTIQHYEIGAKNINRARVDILYKLSKTLGVQIEDLLEKSEL